MEREVLVSSSDEKKKNLMKVVGGWLLFAALAIALVISLVEFFASAKNIFGLFARGNAYVLRYFLPFAEEGATVVFCILAIIKFFTKKRDVADKTFFTLFAFAISFFAASTVNSGYRLAYVIDCTIQNGGGFDYYLNAFGKFDSLTVPILRLCVGILSLVGCLLCTNSAKNKEEGKAGTAQRVFCPVGAFLAYAAISFVGIQPATLYDGSMLSLSLCVDAQLVLGALYFFAVFSSLMQTVKKAGSLSIIMSAIALLLQFATVLQAIIKSVKYVGALLNSVVFVTQFVSLLLFAASLALAIVNLSSRVKREKELGKSDCVEFGESNSVKK
ncbi:MAG: hypothetical protein KH405_00800 [Firmicutes bacterium]|nr:hypothetical protein [Bacillota bacterium]